MGNQIETKHKTVDEQREFEFGSLPENSGQQKAKSGFLTATQEQARLVYTSYGIGVQVIGFLYQKEKIKGQLLNKFVYDVALSRVQTRISITCPYWYVKLPTRFSDEYLVYNTVTREKLKVNGFAQQSRLLVQVKYDAYMLSFSDGQERWTLYENFHEGSDKPIQKSTPLANHLLPHGFTSKSQHILNFRDEKIFIVHEFVDRLNELHCYEIDEDKWH